MELRARCQIVLLAERGLNANRNFTREQRLGMTLGKAGQLSLFLAIMHPYCLSSYFSESLGVLII